MIADYLGISMHDVWQLIHASETDPHSPEALQAEIAELRREVATLRAAVAERDTPNR